MKKQIKGVLGAVILTVGVAQAAMIVEYDWEDGEVFAHDNIGPVFTDGNAPDNGNVYLSPGISVNGLTMTEAGWATPVRLVLVSLRSPPILRPRCG